MGERTRSLFQTIFKSIVSGMKRKTRPTLMGEDYFGTKYYEEPPESSGRKTRGRFFEPVDKENFEQEMPAEWESWLRYRREVPPTKEEIEYNYQMILTKRENAAKLEIEYAAKREPTIAKPETEKHAAGGTFPVYPEYEKFGKNDK